MEFQRVKALAEATPTGDLCDAWGATVDYVETAKMLVRSMTVEEAGELAALHGLTLPDILAV